MNYTDMDMLQDYEKDTRMSAIAYTIFLTEVYDDKLRALLEQAVKGSITSQRKVSELICDRGDRP